MTCISIANAIYSIREHSPNDVKHLTFYWSNTFNKTFQNVCEFHAHNDKQTERIDSTNAITTGRIDHTNAITT